MCILEQNRSCTVRREDFQGTQKRVFRLHPNRKPISVRSLIARIYEEYVLVIPIEIFKRQGILASEQITCQTRIKQESTMHFESITRAIVLAIHRMYFVLCSS